MKPIRRSIQISEETYKELSKLGTLEDSFDTVIQRLLEKEKNPGAATPEQVGPSAHREDGGAG